MLLTRKRNLLLKRVTVEALPKPSFKRRPTIINKDDNLETPASSRGVLLDRGSKKHVSNYLSVENTESLVVGQNLKTKSFANGSNALLSMTQHWLKQKFK